MLFNDDHIVCKCKNKTFKEIRIYAYKKITTNQGFYYQRELVKCTLECTKCGTEIDFTKEDNLVVD